MESQSFFVRLLALLGNIGSSFYAQLFAIFLLLVYHVCSSLYDKQKEFNEAISIPWFEPNLPLSVYHSLNALNKKHWKRSDKEKYPAIPSTVMKAALLRRTVENIKRRENLKEQMDKCGGMLENEDIDMVTWIRLKKAGKAILWEGFDICDEANKLEPGWEFTIFMTAKAMIENEKLRGSLQAIQDKKEEETNKWKKKQDAIIRELLKHEGKKYWKNKVSENGEKKIRKN